MRNQRFRSIVAREPVSFAFCCISLLVFILVFSVPASVPYIALIPGYLTETGYLWTLLTYAVMPLDLTNLVLMSTIILFFGWYMEPALGRVRYITLLLASALFSGLVYVALAPVPASALVGRLFVTSAAGIAFLCWSFPNRERFKSGLRVFWLLAVCWIAYVLWASRLSHSGVHIVAWLVGFFIAIGPTRRST